MALTFRRMRSAFRRSNRRWNLALLAIVGLLGIGIIAGAATYLRVSRDGDSQREAGTLQSALLSAEATATSQTPVEVPDVVGSTLAEARIVLEAAGFSVGFDSSQSPVATATVTAQEPRPGTVADSSSEVTLTVLASSGAAPVRKKAAARWVVVIDPGHQARSDSRPEPIGPGSKTTKPRVTGGTTGVSTGVPEYEVVLQVSNNLRQVLESEGVKVIMTRSTNDVSLSNAERAAIANKAKADLFVRVHADGSPDSSRSGISVLYPAKSKWTAAFAADSKVAAGMVLRNVIALTSAVDLGLSPRSDLAGFNHSEVPCLLVETGFMSNRVEDRLLVSPHYQDRLARGIADGVIEYLKASGE